jgi:hypothetical protein
MAFAVDGKFEMSRKRRKPEKIVAKLRRLECRRFSVCHAIHSRIHITDLINARKNQSNFLRLYSG